ncbi:MAG: FlgD immunoglobulin-like domain containing protein [bacterium]
MSTSRAIVSSTARRPRGASLVAIAAAVLATAALLVFAATTVHAATPFIYETVESSATVGLHTSLALDSQGNPRITYWDAGNGDLKYAARRGGTWTIETIDATGITGLYTSLALDAQGIPHVSYYDDTADDLRYAFKSGATWTRETVDAGGNVGENSSIALDALGAPRISYRDGSNLDLKYASKLGGVWTRETVDGVGSVGQYTSIALDGGGNPHVSYLDNTNFDVKYAKRIAGVWTKEVADPVGTVGQYTSLALDAQANPRIAYHEFSVIDLKYAAKNGGVWAAETVDATGSVGTYASLSLDGAGNPGIAYYDVTNSRLKFASKSGSVWLLEVVDPSGLVGELCSIARDGQGNPKISYFDGGNGDLKFADSGLRVVTPGGGASWAVGSAQQIAWSGIGSVSLSLSLDGGLTFAPLSGPTNDNAYGLRVPHAPTRFARVKVERAAPFAFAISDSFFAINATISLAKFDAQTEADSRNVRLAWETTPGLEADIRYRIEKSAGGASGGEFEPAHAGVLNSTQHVDLGAAESAARYRLVAVNGLGGEYILGETRIAPALARGRDLAIAPNPARDGRAQVVFRAPADRPLGAIDGALDLAIFDTSGRRVRTLADRVAGAGTRSVEWDGRDDAGRDLPSGRYLVRLSWGGGASVSERVTLVR